MRSKYQEGSLCLDSRKIWVFRWRDTEGKRRSMDVGSVSVYRTKKDAKNSPKVADKRAEINRQVEPVSSGPTLRDVISKYAQSEMPDNWTTRRSYWSYINNHLLPMWGDIPLSSIKAAEVQAKIRGLALAPKTKGHIKTLMVSLFRCAMLWEMLELKANPMSLVRIPGSSKRRREPRILSIAEFGLLLDKIQRSVWRYMLLAAMSLGLRCSELLGLKWSDINFVKMEITVQRSYFVGGRVKEWTKGSKGWAVLPLDSLLAAVLIEWRAETEFNQDSDWVWASPDCAGEQPYFGWGIQRRIVKPAGAAAALGPIGWHTLRHTYRTWLDETGAPVKVMQELMRHADIRTTMNVYGKAMDDSKRTANSKVVKMAFRAG